MKIMLLRHGKPSFGLSGKVRSDGVAGVVSQYDLSGICDVPSEEVTRQVSQCRVVVCSHLRRSIASAEALGFIDVNRSDPLFREAEMPHFKAGSLVLPIMAWAAVLRGLSVFGFTRHGESLAMVRRRADVAATVLIELAHRHESVLLVGHGIINHLIARALLSRDWFVLSKPGPGYWGCGVYQSKLS